MERCRRTTSGIEGVLVLGESRRRVAKPREGRRVNAMLIVELIVISVWTPACLRALLSHHVTGIVTAFPNQSELTDSHLDTHVFKETIESAHCSIIIRPGHECFIREPPCLSDHRIEIQQTYSRLQNDLQTLASKIGELEQEAEEHVCVGSYPPHITQ